MQEQFSRNIMYWGEEAQARLKKSHVAVLGLGGVGGYAAEALARAGVGELTLVDFDEVSESNINRQIIAMHSTVGQKKTALFKKRLEDINPNIKLNIFDTFYDVSKNDEIFKNHPDYVFDAIDTMRAKVDLLEFCHINKIPVVSSMGAGNRVDPTKLFIADISENNKSKCSFVKNVIHQLNKKNINSGIVGIFSEETPKKPTDKVFCMIETESGAIKKYSPSSVPFVPPVAGYFAAFFITNEIVKKC